MRFLGPRQRPKKAVEAPSWSAVKAHIKGALWDHMAAGNCLRAPGRKTVGALIAVCGCFGLG